MLLGLLVTSIWHWACPFRWSWYRHVLWFYPSLDLAVHLPLVLSLFCWRPLGSSIVREFTQFWLRFWQGLWPRNSTFIPSRWPPRNMDELGLVGASNSARLRATIVGRTSGEIMQLHIERLWPKWFIFVNIEHIMTAGTRQYIVAVHKECRCSIELNSST